MAPMFCRPRLTASGGDIVYLAPMNGSGDARCLAPCRPVERTLQNSTSASRPIHHQDKRYARAASDNPTKSNNHDIAEPSLTGIRHIITTYLVGISVNDEELQREAPSVSSDCETGIVGTHRKIAGPMLVIVP